MAEARLIFVDSNVPMYLVGEPHPNKDRALETVDRLLGARELLVTDAEVYQEILHRYSAINRFNALEDAFESLNRLVSAVIPIHKEHVERAKEILASVRTVSARDALHLAVMEQAGIHQLLSYDRGFDAIPGVERLE